MIYYLQEELFSFDHFDIWDEQDNVCFQVDREFLTWGKTLRVRDAQGRLCATVHHVPFSIPCSFELETAGGTLELDRHFSLFSRSYSIDSLGWEVEGDFFGVDYAITKGSQTVARMEKAWPAFHDRYRLEIADPADAIAALCTVLAIDCCDEHHQNRTHRSDYRLPLIVSRGREAGAQE